jgi:threonylcarbamoyladenosine tRNA methylthiotransferase MtaB
MKVFFDIVGCRLNQSEVEKLANIFRALGHEIVAEPITADIAIVNTCAVTVKAAADSRKKLRRAARLGAKQVIATGCWATLYPKAALDLPGVSGVILNSEKESLASRLLNIPPEIISDLKLIRQPIPGDRLRTRAFIKVQDGCNNHCTYCLTRIARGRSYSKSVEEITADIKAAIAGGAREIVLSGVQLGAWGHDFAEPRTLFDLLSELLSQDGFNRIRLSSIEPWDFDPELLKLWNDERLCRHFHIPLQSGDNQILRSMGRPITTQQYIGLITDIRNIIPDVAITTDVITGFPGETEAAFQNTIDFIIHVGFAGGHVFTFSPRPGTAAVKMEDQVSIHIARQRNAILQEIFRKQRYDFADKFIGTSMQVLWESGDLENPGVYQLSGLTDNYIRVFAEAKRNLWNEISLVSLKSHHLMDGGVNAEIVKEF